MKSTMKRLATHLCAPVMCALLTGALTGPAYADKACSASLNLQNCVSSLDLNSVTFVGGTLTASGVLRLINSGAGSGTILSVVANLQVKDQGDQYATIATITAPCGTGLLILTKALPLAVPGGANICGGVNEQDIGFTTTFAGVSLVSRKQARIEFQVTYDGAPNGSAGQLCGATPACGTRVINVRFGFVVP
jgi:hypothetical protein